MTLIERLQSRTITALWRLMGSCSTRTLWRIAGILAPLYTLLARRERRVTRINLRRAWPELTDTELRPLARQSLRHSVAMILELGFAWYAEPQRVSNAIHRVHGRELLDEARAEGRGVIVLGPHFGNWELLNFWLSGHFPITAMYEPPKMAALGPLIRQGRERNGATLVPTTSRGVASLLRALRRSEVVGILPDQVPDWGSGVFADFFGHPAYTGTLLPGLVARTQARVVTGFTRRLPNGEGFDLHFLAADERVYDPDEAVSAAGVNACVEAAIALDPAQYQWEYKRWRKTPGEETDEPGWRERKLYNRRHR
ncbi:lysophospholipid acyltransferase family protein [Kushneria phosphatilytica]|uniref:Lysophospholipid acyltransferase family protein n=1 Tax=Kushneria phosphatilytica TaxID=657387 RepID=A0A1S1NVN9_9GAMM|nr:lysophospholipid acyltransferase family protein [Kushneria phosphatilytica]OHV10647.1 lipid A biosynthesis acyltransferase [Kushneria phosphatilytica]QEL12858.1 lysophospholipid acyltransferase family protein [Kushneria phosphatilytica]